MKIIDGTGARLGRLSSYVAKQALKGEKIAVVNCKDVIISGKKKSIEKDFLIKRSRIGHSQKGPKHHKSPRRIVKRAIRGMLPNHRKGRGKKAFKRIKCYKEIPGEFREKKLIKGGKEEPFNFIRVEEVSK